MELDTVDEIGMVSIAKLEVAKEKESVIAEAWL